LKPVSHVLSSALAVPSILIVDDDPIARELLVGTLSGDGYDVEVAESGKAALDRLKDREFSVILSDVEMTPIDGLELLRALRERGVQSVPILMTGYGTLSGAVSAIHSGAFDYLSKPFKPPVIRQAVRRAAAHWKSRLRGAQEVAPASEALPTLVGRSPVMVEVYRLLALASLGEGNVLIRGESGTGKELVARAIYQYSRRKEKPFVAVNCNALSETLLESELFGHVRGAFTGATSNKQGLFDEANGGTLFLDEIGDISLNMQVKLLRALQDGEIKPVGGNESHRVNVRVLAATHRDLEERIGAGLFREDLFYRLKVIHIEIPPLRSRLEDLPTLVQFFIERHRDPRRNKVSVSNEAMQALQNRFWPGNVRELEHAVQHALTMSQGCILYAEDFPASLSDKGIQAVSAATGLDIPTGNLSLEDVERRHIQYVLRVTGFNKSKAADILGIDRATLYRKAKKFRLTLEKNETLANE
jgi:two-component system, NtrC family, response regulator AtoC